MSEPRIILERLGFYLLLLFAFSISVLPAVAYCLALTGFLLWMIDVFIFRNQRWLGLSLFYPILTLAVFSLLTFLLSLTVPSEFNLAYVGMSSLLYFVVVGFVSSIEKRKMVLWSFLAGALAASGVELVAYWDSFLNGALPSVYPSSRHALTVAISLSLLIAFYAEAKNLKEKLFYGFLLLPLAAVALLSAERFIIMITLAIFLVVVVLKDRTVLVVMVLLIVASVSIHKQLPGTEAGNSVLSEYAALATSPIGELNQNQRVVTEARFFGAGNPSPLISPDSRRENSFFLNFLKASGPPSLVLLLWIMIGRVRTAFAKWRKVGFLDARVFHLGLLLSIVAMFLCNIYSSAFSHLPAVLTMWLILGMSEI